MSSYLIFLAGVLFDNHDAFVVSAHTSSQHGRYLTVFVKKGHDVPKEIEIIEVRGGKMTKRFRLIEQEKRPKDSLMLVGVPNDF